jgi:CBS domain-containing membrane protein
MTTRVASAAATETKLCVRDLMTEQVIAVKPDTDLTAVRDLLWEHNIRHLPVVDGDGDLIGLVSQRDLLRHALINQHHLPDYVEEAVLERLKASDIMTANVERVGADTDLREAAQTMFDNKYGCLPVTEGDRLVGILTESDFVRFLGRGD